jgi:beta-galactosidase
MKLVFPKAFTIACAVIASWWVLSGPASTAYAQTYTPPASNRSDLLLDDSWKFILADVPGATNVVFDDSSWTSITLPHTWNNLDGQDGGGNYFRGIGWYRRHYTVDGSYTNREIFLKFDGANIVADV